MIWEQRQIIYNYLVIVIAWLMVVIWEQRQIIYNHYYIVHKTLFVVIWEQRQIIYNERQMRTLELGSCDLGTEANHL